MNRLGNLLTKHRNLFLLLLLVMTLLVSSAANRERLAAASATVEIPITETSSKPVSALEAYRLTRDEAALNDISALEALCSQVNLDSRTREDAAQRLQEITGNRQAQTALEGALLNSSLYPCVAVVSGGSVTIVTEKSAVTDQDAALVMTLASAHAGVSPENVRIIAAE